MKNIFQKRSRENQHGAIMLLLVLLLIPILLAIGMVIDTSRLTTSDSELERIANSMSLGALEDYLRTDGTAAERATAAKARAVQIATLDSNSLLAAEENTFDISDFDDPNKATIDFGTWFFEEPAVSCDDPTSTAASPCPCQDGVFTGPCFQGGVTDPFQVNAARMEIRTQTDTITSSVGSLLKLNNIQLQASSTVAAVPRNGVFLIDLSRSTQFQTHLPFEQQTPATQSQASEFAFRLTPGAPGQPGTGFTCADLNAANNCINTPAIQAKRTAYCAAMFPPGPGSDPNAQATCNAQCPPITPFAAHQAWYVSMAQGGASTDPTVHYRNSYQCVSIHLPDNSTEDYLVEKNQPAAKRPEPLATILGGIHEALQTVKTRSIAGDTVTLIGFDGQIFAANPGDTIRTYGPSNIGTSEFNKIDTLTDPATSFDNLIPEFLFPGAGPNRGATDIAGALVTARNLLRDQPNFNVARNFVVLFSDGLSSCYHGNPAPNSSGCMFTAAGQLSPTQCLAPSPANVTLAGYNNGYNVHLYGLKEATQVISRQDSLDTALDPNNRHSLPSAASSCGGAGAEESYFELGIKFHYFAIGTDVRPFSLSYANAAATDCATEEELLDIPLDTSPLAYQSALFTKLVQGNCAAIIGANPADTAAKRAACMSDGTYAQSHQDLYTFGVYQTRGVYAPVRPPCTPAGGGNIDDMKKEFKDRCDAANPKSSTNSLSPVEHPGFTFEESATRQLLTCDPEGLTPAEQIRNNIQNIYGDNPFIVVE